MIPSRAGAVWGGFIAALTTPLGFSYLRELVLRSGSGGQEFIEGFAGWGPFLLAPLFGLWLHALLQRERDYFLLPAARWALQGSAIASWPRAGRAALAVTVTLIGSTALIGGWVLLLRG